MEELHLSEMRVSLIPLLSAVLEWHQGVLWLKYEETWQKFVPSRLLTGGWGFNYGMLWEEVI